MTSGTVEKREVREQVLANATRNVGEYQEKIGPAAVRQGLSSATWIPGMGKIPTPILLQEIHDINRFPRVWYFASYFSP
jgi:hypothetical protein